ncbi:hypothetical protein CVIRNUC_006237 [Coccomyxa viridis]|uniref:Photolyase/cryptochrome alpha/beta domain-containing protein n=1 Tax=Coccomyxa viridis TaxID=1274662 RepID=A0AAV1IA02_9CHLO|nr:hypothetical protein CVIRNUC_006237 [Coccomyxa viridis]
MHNAQCPSQLCFRKSARKVHTRRFSIRAVTAGATAGAPPRPIIVWLKHDLRLDDNPGLQDALQETSQIVPAFCMDPKLYVHLQRTPNGVPGLLGALGALRKSLNVKGSGLVVRYGALPKLLRELVLETGAAGIIAEEEVEHRWLEALREATAGLPEGVRITTWKGSLFDNEPYVENYREFQQKRGASVPPLKAPLSLPALPDGIAPGNLPTAKQLLQDLADADCTTLHPEVREEAQGVSEGWPGGTPPVSLQLTQGGEAAALPAFQQYLHCRMESGSAATSSGRGQSMRDAVDRHETAAAPLESFPAIFSQAMSLGLLSKRRVYHEATQLLQKQSGTLKAFTGRKALRPARAAVTAAEAADFHWHIALADRARCMQGNTGFPRHWRWRGFMTDFCTRMPSEEGAEEIPGAPAILLVHGFGAFGEQWRGQLSALAKAGYQVYAPTIPGFGRSEKPALAYSQTLWLDFLREFVIEVVRRPVVVVGNSIGGFISASLAAAAPAIVKALVLVNSAGKIVPDYAPAPEDAPVNGKTGPPALVADVVSWGIFNFLERSIAKTLVRLYPISPAMADQWLVREIFRGACDPGALAVFRSVFYLPPPKPLNYLVQDLYGGPCMVLQGALDPLNDARARAAALQAACSNVEVQLIGGGHCPHDEVSAEFNAALLPFLARQACSTHRDFKDGVSGRETAASDVNLFTVSKR